MTIYERIRMLRVAQEMSQYELAKRVGYEGRSAISKVENGSRDISQSMIAKYAAALGVTPEYLLYGEEGTSVDDWTKTFCKSVDEQLSLSDPADLADSGADVERLSEVASGVNKIYLSEACNIADEFGCSLDTMVGRSSDELTQAFTALFSRLNPEQKKLAISILKGIINNK